MAAAGLAVVLLLFAALLGWLRLTQPQPLSQYVLVGPRGPACLRLILANDVSGSMTSFAAPRENALTQLLAWAPDNLRPDDEVGVLSFAGSAAWISPPRPIGELRQGTPIDPAIEQGTTSWAPVVELVAALPASPCLTTLWFISDGLYDDYPSDESQGQARLSSAGVHDTRLLVPAKDIDVPEQWERIFPSAAPMRFDGSDGDETARVYAGELADLTGQRLRKG